MPKFPKEIEHSEKYYDELNEYKHVVLTERAAYALPRHRCLRPNEYQKFGIMQTPGWVHYFSVPHERHILMFKRPLRTNQLPN